MSHSNKINVLWQFCSQMEVKCLILTRFFPPLYHSLIGVSKGNLIFLPKALLGFQPPPCLNSCSHSTHHSQVFEAHRVLLMCHGMPRWPDVASASSSSPEVAASKVNSWWAGPDNVLRQQDREKGSSLPCMGSPRARAGRRGQTWVLHQCPEHQLTQLRTVGTRSLTMQCL